ncbi:unnamed protein product, partial [Vitis vinifera]|uniref:Uncharacterized protein n=1 Tax=Vitis vinifera TaxID=29760 RepID=D7U1W5_VITVI
MAFGRLRSIHNLYRTAEIRPFSYLLGSSRSYSIVTINVPKINCWATSYFYKGHNVLPWTCRSTMTLHSSMPTEPWILLNDARLLTTRAKAPAQVRQMVSYPFFLTDGKYIALPQSN